MLSGILQLLFNAADIIVVGKFAGDESLAAVGSTGSLINLLTNRGDIQTSICPDSRIPINDMATPQIKLKNTLVWIVSEILCR